MANHVRPHQSGHDDVQHQDIRSRPAGRLLDPGEYFPAIPDADHVEPVHAEDLLEPIEPCLLVARHQRERPGYSGRYPSNAVHSGEMQSVSMHKRVLLSPQWTVAGVMLRRSNRI